MSYIKVSTEKSHQKVLLYYTLDINILQECVSEWYNLHIRN